MKRFLLAIIVLCGGCAFMRGDPNGSDNAVRRFDAPYELTLKAAIRALEAQGFEVKDTNVMVNSKITSSIVSAVLKNTDLVQTVSMSVDAVDEDKVQVKVESNRTTGSPEGISSKIILDTIQPKLEKLEAELQKAEQQ